MDNNYGVITEQGFPVGQMGFEKITEAEREKLNEACDKERAKQSQ